jgi:ribosomal protein S12 methylthiotransferase accessory factor
MEILERHALAGAENIPHFFDEFQVELSTVTAEVADCTLQQVTNAGFLVGAWRVPAFHGLPVYLCHVMESGRYPELAPLPADGSACHFSHGKALVGALLEACQGRLAAISGAREDITRGLYPSQFDREHLAVWRGQLQSPGRISFPSETGERQDEMAALPMISDALAQAGANSAYVVPLFGDDAASLYVVRLVAPPLLTTPRSSS